MNNKYVYKPKKSRLKTKYIVDKVHSGKEHTVLTTKNFEILTTGSALHGKLGISNISYSKI